MASTEPAPISIGRRQVGPGHPAYIIAEMSANHNQSYDRAVEILRAAKASGADAIKLQTYTPDTITLKSDAEAFRLKEGSLWSGKVLHELYSEAYMPWEWQPRLMEEARRAGLDLISTPFDPTAVDFLAKMGVPAFKIASFEVVDLPLIRHAARHGKPLIISTGMATLSEIEEAVDAARGAGAAGVVLLRCTSAYPAPPDEADLRSIPHLAASFHLPVGLSDHTLGTAVPTASVALGACVIEKHFTLSRSEPGPDSAFSLEPHEFKQMVHDVRVAEAALGRVRYGPRPHEVPNRGFRRSLFVVRDVRAGETLTIDNVRSIRPASGLHTRHLEEVLGRPAATDIRAGTPLDWSHLGRVRKP